MTSLQEKLSQQELGDALLNLTNDLDTVLGLKMTSALSAEIWISAPGARETVESRCAEHEVLKTLELTFREELDEATASGGATKRPRNSEPKDENKPDPTFDEFEEHITSDGPPEEVDE